MWYKKIAIIIAVVMMAANSYFVAPNVCYAANEVYTQTDWSGGSSASNAVHPTDKTGWNKYSSKDANVDTAQAGKVILSPASNSMLSTTDADFNLGIYSHTELSGTGAGASVKLTATTQDPFSSGLNSWLMPAQLPASVGPGGALVYPGTGDFIYAAKGNFTKEFLKYSVSLKRWYHLANLPKPIGPGADLAYYNGYVYCMQGNGWKGFWRYSIAGDSWEALASTPDAVAYGGKLVFAVWNANNGFFASKGNATTTFWFYNISANTWAAGPNLPENAQNGATFAWDGATYVYFVRGNGYQKFYRLNLTTNVWGTLPDTPSTCQQGASIVYEGVGGYIYLLKGEDRPGFYRYSIGGNSWETLAHSPGFVTYGGDMVYNSNNNTFYAWGGYGGDSYEWYPELWEYSPVSGKWTPVSYTLWKLNEGADLCYDGTTYIYATGGYRGYTGSDARRFYRYSPASNVWEQLADTPTDQGRGGAIVYAGGYVYAFRGGGWNRNFWRYNISADSWESKTDITTGDVVDSGASLVYPGSGDYIYAVTGGGKKGFYLYTISTDTWSSLAQAPQNIGAGADLVYYSPGTGDYIYCFGGNSTGNFFRYSVIGNTWETLTACPKNIDKGGDLAYPGTGNYIYAMTGNETNYFLRFSISGNSWEYLESLPLWTRIWDGASLVYGGGNDLYATRGLDGRDFVRYSITAGKWDAPSAVDTDAFKGASLVKAGNYFYCTQGHYTKIFLRYSLTQDKWEYMSSLPKPVGDGGALAYTGGDVIYAMIGGYQKNFYKYIISTDTWTEMAPALNEISESGSLAWNGLDYIYALRGANLQDFYRYIISTDTWENRAFTPSAVDYGHSLLAWTGGDYIYCLKGVGKDFWRYTISTNMWSSMASTPLDLEEGSIIAYPGTGDYVYCLQGGAGSSIDMQNGFFRYSISGNSWTALARTPYPISYGSTIACAGDLIYVMPGYWRGKRDFFHYSISNNVWSAASGAKYFGWNGCITTANGEIYGLQADDSTNFNKYSPVTNTWSALAALPANARYGASICYAKGSDYIYAFRGWGSNDFYRYSITNNKWEALTSTPSVPSNGASLCYPGSGDYVYALRGDGTAGFWKYSITNNIWQSIAAAPGLIESGAYMASDGADYLYTVRGYSGTEFYRYSIGSNSWQSIASTPGPLRDGGGLCYPGFGDYIYGLRGYVANSDGYSSDFWRYSISANAWEQLDSIPVFINSASGLVYPGGNYLYAIPGQSYYMLKYLLFSTGTYVSGAAEAGTNGGFGTMTWNDNTDNKDNFVELKIRTANDSTMSSAASWTNAPLVTKGSDLSVYSSVSDGHSYIQSQITFRTSDLTKIPQLDDATMNYDYYPQKQDLISSAYNTAAAGDRLMKLYWNKTLPVGTDVRFQLRTAPDSGGAPGSWGTWIGPSGTTFVNNDFSLENDYSRSTLLKLNAGNTELLKDLQDFQYKQPVTVDNTGGSAVSNAVVGITLSGLNNEFWSGVKSSGDDIRFFDGTQKLAYNLVSFDYTKRTALINVKIPALAANEIKTIYILYGSANAISENDSTVNTVPATGLKCWWKLDESSGTAVSDSSGNSNSAIFINTPSWVSGKFANALQFDGIDDFVSSSSAGFAITGAITISMWIKPDVIKEQGLCAKYDNSSYWSYRLYMASNGNIVFERGSVGSAWKTTLTSNTYVKPNEWVHITAAFDSSTMKLYINNTLEKSVSETRAAGNNAGMPFVLGTNSYDNSAVTTYIASSFDGIIENFVMYNRGLSASEVEALYYGNLGISTSLSQTNASEENIVSSVLGANWPYRKTAKLTNSSSYALADYQVPVDITSAIYNDIGLVGSWHFNEAVGTLTGITVDSSGSGNNGTLSGFTGPNGIVSSGKYGNGMQFDGSNDYVDAGNAASLNITNQITLEAWVKVTNPTDNDNRFIIGKSEAGGYKLLKDNANQFRAEFYVAGQDYGSAVSNNAADTNWTHLVATYNGSLGLLYVNGVAQTDNTTKTGTIGVSAVPVTIGANADLPGPTFRDFFNGIIDEVRIYNRVLSAQEVLDRYNATKLRPDLADLRFIRINPSDGTEQLLSHWIENDFKAWVKIPSMSAYSTQTMYMYYGNSTGASTSNFENVFSKDYGESGLIGLWHMDAGSGNTAADSSGNSNDMDLKPTPPADAPQWQVSDGGQWDNRSDIKFSSGSALYFDGTNDYLDLSAHKNDYEFNTPVGTLSMWVKSQGAAAFVPLFYFLKNSGSNACIVREADNGQIIAWSFLSSGTGNFSVLTPVGSVTRGSWYHLAIAQTGSGIEIYINGVKQTLTGPNGTLWFSTLYPPTDGITIGHIGVWSNYFNGYIDEVRIYNRALSSTEIYRQYVRSKYASASVIASFSNYNQSANSYSLSGYYTNNPVIQPIFGAFYNNDLAEFQETAVKPAGSEIKYQVSPNGYRWYWWNGSAWALVTGGYSQANTASAINSNLAAFMSQVSTSGEFFYRAFLHSDTGAAAPLLDQVKITTASSTSFYLDSTGATAINTLHGDAFNDQWFQYKVSLYSSGKDTPILDDVTLEYLNTSIAITSPNGTETWQAGSSHNITWNSTGLSGSDTVTIEYSTDGGTTWKLITATATNTGTYPWAVNNDISNQVKIRVTSNTYTSILDTSDVNFYIWGIKITSPNGAESWEQGTAHNITWTSVGTVSNQLTIEYSKDNFSTAILISDQQTNDGTYPWSVPVDVSNSVKVRVRDIISPFGSDTSDANFTILPVPQITVTSPNGSEVWKVGSARDITWSTNMSVSNNLKLEYSKDNFASDINTIVNEFNKVGWSYYKTVTIDNTANLSALTNYQIALNPVIYDNTGLVGSWHFSEGSGTTTKDMSGNNNNGTLNGGLAWTSSGKFGNALSFDGTDDYVDVGTASSLKITGAITVEAWVKGINLQNNKTLVWKSDAYGLSTPLTGVGGTSNRFTFTIKSGSSWQSISHTEDWVNGDWYHIVGTYDGSQMSITVNGVRTSRGQTGTIDSNNEDLIIGASTYGGYVNSFIDEVRVYSRALSAAEIAALYNSGTPKARHDYADIRFTNTSGTELSYWQESDSKFWVKVDSIPAYSNKTVYMYYGNLSAASASNGTNTFEFFDDFEGGSLDTAKWNQWTSGGAISVANSEVDIRQGQIISKTYQITDAVFEYKAKIITIETCSFVRSLVNSGNAYANSGTVGFASVIGYPGLEHSIFVADVDKANTSNAPSLNTPYNYRVTMSGNSYIFKRLDSNWSEQASVSYTDTGGRTTGYIGLRDNEALNKEAKYDWVRVRKYSSTEPAVSLGVEKDENGIYYKRILIDNTGNPSALTDYQVKINIDSTYIYTTFWDKVNSDGSGISFFDGSTELSYWIESFDYANKNAVIWVKVPSIPASSTKTIYMYYCNSTGVNTSNFDNIFIKDYGESGLAALWHFDAGSGTTAADVSGNNNNGTLINDPAWLAQDGGQWGSSSDVKFSTGSALSFDGLDDYVDMGTASILEPTNVTLEAWVKLSSLSTTQTIAGQDTSVNATGKGYELFFYEPGQNWCFSLRGSDWQTAGTTYHVDTTNWHHLVGTYDGASLKLYVDGVLKDSITTNMTIQYRGDFSFRVGAASGFGGFKYVNGLIDEVRVYNRALSADEIKGHYERRKYSSPEPTTSALETTDNTIYSWIIPDDVSSTVKVRITDNTRPSCTDKSDNNFSITQPGITITAPNGGESWAYGDTRNITWTTEGLTNNSFLLEYSKDNFASDIHTVAGTPMSGWQYYKAVTIDNSSNSNALANYQVAVNPAIYDNTGLAGSWHFSEGSGTTTKDMSGNGKNGTLNGGPAWTTSGRFGNALSFDGTDDYVSLGDIDAALDLTISVWIKANVLPAGYSDIVTKCDGVNIENYFIETNGDELAFGFNNGGFREHITTTANLTTGSWYHVVATYSDSANRVKIYVNGVKKLDEAETNSLVVNNESTDIGAGYLNENFNGLIDEVRIYTRALSESEVSALYNSGSPKVRHDYADIRFTNSSSTELPYWQETDSKFWVKVDSIPASSAATIKMYYGNSAISSASSGVNTFEFFDDFESGILSKWTLIPNDGFYTTATDQKYSGNYSMRVTGLNSVEKSIVANGLSLTNCIMDAMWRMNNTDLDVAQTVRANSNNPVSRYETNYWQAGGWDIAKGIAGTWNEITVGEDAAATNTWIKITTIINGTQMKVLKNDAQITPPSGWSDVGGELTAPGSVGFNAYRVITGRYWWLDDVRVRKFTSPEPVSSLASEQPNSAAVSGNSYSWTIPNDPSSTVKVRITDTLRPAVTDTSDNNFAIIGHSRVSITSPNGSETLIMGDTHNITWTSDGQNVSDQLKLEYSINNGSSWTLIAQNQVNDGSYTWTVPSIASTQGLVKITDANDALITDTSNASFTIVAPSLTITSPNGAEVLIMGTSHNITWTSQGQHISNNLKLEYSINNGSAWVLIAETQANDGSFSWTVPNSATAQGLVKITDADTPSVTDISNANFTITSAPITLISPNGSEAWQSGSNHNITWNNIILPNGDTIKIEYSSNAGTTWNLIKADAAHTGTYSWTINPDGTNQARVRITSNALPAVTDTSDANFTIFGIRITSPNGTESWEQGTTHNITWTSQGTVSNQLTIEYSKDNFATATLISDQQANDTTYSWLVPNDVSNSVKVRVRDIVTPFAADTSNANFTILPVPQMAVTSPNGSESWKVGSSYDITWSTNMAVSDSLKLEYSKDNFAGDIHLISNVYSLDGWPYYKAVTIDNSGNASTLADYQVKINIDNSDTSFWNHVKSDGSDIRLYEGVTQLSYWIESFNYAGKTALIWAKVPSIAASSTKTIYLYYGKPDALNAGNFSNVFTKDYGDSGLAGAWHFDEGNGITAADASGNNNSGTLLNSPVWQGQDGGQWGPRSDVKFSTGSALSFDGLDDYVSVPYNTSLNFTNAITIEVWLKPNTTQNDFAQVIGRQETATGWMLRYGSNNKLGGRFGNGTAAENFGSVGSTPTGVWTHVALIFNGTQYIFYFNGIAESPISATIGSISTYPYPLYIGNDDFTANRYFNGSIDEARIYNRALSAAEIQAHYQRRKYSSPEPAASLGAEKTAGTYYKRFTINNSGNANTLTDYQVKVNIDNTYTYTAFWNNVKSDGSDIRFFDGPTELSYWIESFDYAAKSAVIWVKVLSIPASSNKTIYMYYCNSAGVKASNGADTFEFFDDFSGAGLDTNKWNSAGTVSVSSGSVYVNGAGSYISAKTDFPVNYAFVTRSKFKQLSNFSYGLFSLWDNDPYHQFFWIQTYASAYPEYGGFAVTTDVAAGGPGEQTSTADKYWDTWYRFEVIRDSTAQVIFKSDGNTEVTHLSAVPTQPWHFKYASDANSYIYTDYSFVRKYSFLEPTVSAQETTDNTIYSWVIPDDVSSTVKVRITDNTRPLCTDTSDSNFSIVQPTITLTAPNGAEVWPFGDTRNITWTTDGITSNNYLLEYSKDNFASDINPIAGTPMYGWPYYKVVTINNTANSSALTNYQVAVNPAIYDNTGLVGSWHFSEGSGTTANDRSGNGNNGTIIIGASGSQTTVAQAWANGASGRFGRSMSFDGTDDYVNFGSQVSLDALAPLTISAWIYPTTSGGALYDTDGGPNGDGYTLNLEAANAINFFIDTTGSGIGNTWRTSVSNAIILNFWQYVVVTWDGTNNANNIHIYVNGQEVAYSQTNSGTGTVNDAANDKRVGGSFNGFIDEAQIYSRALSAAEINARYNSGSPKVRHDYADIRFTNSLGTELSYWQETDSKFWVKVDSVPASSTQTIKMYYGNSSATSLSSTIDTFIRVIDGGQSLKGSWNFSEGSGTTVADTSGNTNTGTFSGTGTTWTSAGKFGNALNLDGNESYADFGDTSSLNITNQITLEAWVKETNPIDNSGRHIIAKSESAGYKLLKNDTNKFEVQVTIGGSGKTAISDNVAGTNWTHLVGTYNGSIVRLYVDGVLQANTTSSTGAITVAPVPLAIGANSDLPGPTYSGHFVGIIDNVRVYSTALSLAEITDLYNNYGYTTTNYPGRVLVRKYSSPEPAFSLASEQSNPLAVSGNSYSWVIPNDPSSTVKVRITDYDRPVVTDTSDNNFQILGHSRVTVTSPNGSETLIMGDSHNITWASDGQNVSDQLKLEYSTNNGSSWTLIADQQVNDGTYTWTVPLIATIQGLVRITDANDALITDVSDANFTIAIPTVTVTAPNGAETWYATGSFNITWSSVGAVSNNLLLEYTSNGSTWTQIATGQSNSGSFAWTVPDIASSTCKVRITDNTRPAVIDESNANFTIAAPTITVSIPNGTEEWAVGTAHDITWTSVGTNNSIKNNLTLQYSKDNFVTPVSIATGEANDGVYSWTVPDDVSATVKVKIFDATRPATVDTSDNNFSITAPYVRVTAPNGGESWVIGTPHNITWISLGAISDNLTIEYSKDNFTTPVSIAAGEANDGAYSWTLPDDVSNTVKVRITDVNRPSAVDVSDTSFTIANSIITVTRPNGTELFTAGDSENIAWTVIGTVSNDLKLEYSKDNFAAAGIQIATGVANSGTYPWTVANDVSTAVRIRITDNARPAVTDKSNVDFTILPGPVITIFAPNGGENWRVGSAYTISWSDNGGLISNNLTIQYSINGGGAWTGISTVEANDGAYSWTIPNDVSNNCKVRIFDAVRPTTEDESDLAFNITLPVITITTPNGGESYAVDDSAPVTWTTEGVVSNNLTLEYTTDGSNFTLIKTGEANDGSFSWTVPDMISSTVKLRITDGDRPAVVDLSNANFSVISNPTVTVSLPNGGETYEIGDVLPISWTYKGLGISPLTIIYSSNDFAASTTIATSVAYSAGSYNWTIPNNALTTNTLKVRIYDPVKPVITDDSNANFRIKGGFTITAPVANARFIAKKAETISWTTKGTVANVKLEYSVDNGTNWTTIISSVANTGSYIWDAADTNMANYTAKIRISDAADSTVSATMADSFMIDYYTITWRIIDYESTLLLDGLSVNDSVWSDSTFSISAPANHEYPYGSYTTFWKKTNYFDGSLEWAADSDKTITVTLENLMADTVEWRVVISNSYNADTDTLRVSTWLERRGALVGTSAAELANLTSSTVEIYDGTNLVRTMTINTHDNQGVFWFNWANTGLEADKTYFIKAIVTYQSSSYTSGSAVDVTSAKKMYEDKLQLQTIQTQVNAAKASVDTSATQISGISSKIDSSQTSIEGKVADVKLETAKILTAAETSIPERIELARTEAEITRKSEILNRESTLRIGQLLVVRYRTYTGLSPKLDVYNSSNSLKVNKARMTEVGTTGIYEYPVKFESSWGKGDFTIVCSESTKGTMDAMIISVISTDIEQVSGEISAVLGTTQNLDDVGKAAETLTTQFNMIESALDKISKDVVNQVKDMASSAAGLEAVYTQLVNISKELQGMGDSSGLDLEKLLDVAEEKKNDLMYLKNKTEELKAAMEINNKMLQNSSKKPVVQTWFEFK